MSSVVYDAAVLIAADRSDYKTWAQHKTRLEFGILPAVPAPVVAQVSRSPRQAQLRRFLAGCVITPFTASDAHEAGHLLGRAGTADIADAALVMLAIRNDAQILTGDPDDIKRLASAAGRKLSVIGV